MYLLIYLCIYVFIFFFSGSSSISRYLASVDSTYGAYFAGEKWRDLSEREINEVVNKIGLYMNNGTSTIFLPVAEAMLTYKEKRFLIFIIIFFFYILLLYHSMFLCIFKVPTMSHLKYSYLLSTMLD